MNLGLALIGNLDRPRRPGRDERWSGPAVGRRRGHAHGRPRLRRHCQPRRFTSSNGQTLTFTANRNLTLFLLETLGAVNLTATTGNITLNNDIGPHIINNTNRLRLQSRRSGVASLTISAPAATATVTMQGARAQGDVVISTGGTLTAAKQITSVFGTVSIFAAGGATLSAVPIGNQDQMSTVWHSRRRLRRRDRNRRCRPLLAQRRTTDRACRCSQKSRWPFPTRWLAA